MTIKHPLAEDCITSRWPLPATGIRQLTPQFMLAQLQQHPLSRDLLPLAMGYYPRASQHRMQRRSHDSYLLIYCTAGSGELQLAGATSAVSAGDMILLPPGQAHSYRADRRTPWTIFWVHFVGPGSADFARFTQLECGVNNIGVHARLIDGFEELFNIRRQGLTLQGFIQASNHLRALLTRVGGVVAWQHRSLGSHIGMNQLLQYMQRHINRDLDLEALAELANLSKFHFIRRFRQATGHTPIQHFIHLRMERACELLDTSTVAVKAVAAQLGYTDPLYFSRQFKKVIGISPQKYRQLHGI